jgi:hypothetical protein
MRGITGVTLKSCCLRCSASTCCPHLVSTVTGEDRQLGCGPVTHLVRSGPSSGLAGLGPTRRTGLSGSSLPVPLGPGPAILPALLHRRLGRNGDPVARLAAMALSADGSPVCLPQRTRSPCSLRDASASNQLASDCVGGKHLAARGRFQRARPVACRGAPGRRQPACCLPYLPRLGLIRDCQSTPKSPSIPQHRDTLSVPQACQQIV